MHGSDGKLMSAHVPRGGSGRRAAPAVPIRDSSSFVVGGLYLHGSAAKMQPDPDLVRFDGSVRFTGLL
ncbi:hypothetical protein [Rhodococcus sp. 5G237]